VLLATAILTALRLAYAARVGLTPQEAYYWQYARHLDLSYFDHPPLAAWLIAASVGAFGTSEWAVRLPAVLSGAGLTLLVHRLGTRLVSAEAGALAAAAANATVLFGIGAVVVTPDVPLVLCWTAALGLACELLLPGGGGAGRGSWRWFALGASCGLALLSKYTAALLPPQLLAAALALPAGRRWLRTPWPWVAALVALSVFSPVLVWNARHGWASFAFQTTGRASDSDGAHAFLAVRYLALQLLATGLLYPLLLASVGWLGGRARSGDPRAVLLFLCGAPGVLIFTAMSPWIFVKMNWVGPAYVALLLAVAWWWSERRRDRRVRLLARATLAGGTALALAAHLVPLVPGIPFRARDDLVTGWRELAAAVDAARGSHRGPDPLVIGGDYKTASELAFYLRGRPGTQVSAALGRPGLAYEFWPDGAAARDALVVADDRRGLGDAASRLAEHCASVEALEPLTVRRGAQAVTTFRLWRCLGWHRGRVASAPVSGDDAAR
jgi:4-amino-4-deoxy-L-arabinose transferase-like glycosyltransferase